jgi:hypothetical protein
MKLAHFELNQNKKVDALLPQMQTNVNRDGSRV